MKRIFTISGTIILTLGILLTVINVMPVLAADATYTKVQTPFTVDPTQPGLQLEKGSTIHHLPNGTTEVYRMDASLALKSLDADATMIQTPNGMKKANYLYRVPDGVKIDITDNTAQVFDTSGTRILTVIDDTQAHVAEIQTMNGGTVTQAANGATTTQATNGSVSTHSTAGGSYSPNVIPWGGYLEQAHGPTTGVNLDTFIAYWQVPNSPPNTNGSEVNYIFNGIEPLPACRPIIQPVLSWNLAGYAHRWTGEPWYVWTGGSFIGAVILVNPHDSCEGLLQYNQTTHYWDVHFYDISTSWSSGFSTSVNPSHNFNTSNLYLLTALEVYNVSSNSDVCGTINFNNMVLNYNNNHVGMIWAGQFGSGSPVTGLQIITYGTDNSLVTLGTPN